MDDKKGSIVVCIREYEGNNNIVGKSGLVKGIIEHYLDTYYS